MTNTADWPTTLAAAMDALDHAVHSKGDDTQVLARATAVLKQLEEELPTLDAATRQKVEEQLPAMNARFAVLTEKLAKARDKVGEQMKTDRTRAAAMKSYTGAPK